jgi:hypothetical protein
MTTMFSGTEVQIVPFATVLQAIDRGAIAARAAELLAELTRSVMELEKGGTIVVTMKIEPTKNAPANTLTVTADVKATMPKDARARILYADDTGALSDRHPEQPELPFRVVGSERDAAG